MVTHFAYQSWSRSYDFLNFWVSILREPRQSFDNVDQGYLVVFKHLDKFSKNFSEIPYITIIQFLCIKRDVARDPHIIPRKYLRQLSTHQPRYHLQKIEIFPYAPPQFLISTRYIAHQKHYLIYHFCILTLQHFCYYFNKTRFSISLVIYKYLELFFISIGQICKNPPSLKCKLTFVPQILENTINQIGLIEYCI